MDATLISIDGRSETGASKPFHGEASDGRRFLLKQRNVTADRLVIEYLFSRLAEEFGLPVAPVALLTIPSDLVTYSRERVRDELVAGKVFGSQQILFADDLRHIHLPQVDHETQLMTLCFDWWVHNQDRRLDRMGGDSNLLWDPTLQQVVLIDFDSCLDPDFDPVSFRHTHAFRDCLSYLEKPKVEKWRTRFESTIYHIGRIWDEIPREWLKEKNGKNKTSFNRRQVESKLMKPPHPILGLLPFSTSHS